MIQLSAAVHLSAQPPNAAATVLSHSIHPAVLHRKPMLPGAALQTTAPMQLPCTTRSEPEQMSCTEKALPHSGTASKEKQRQCSCSERNSTAADCSRQTPNNTAPRQLRYVYNHNANVAVTHWKAWPLSVAVLRPTIYSSACAADVQLKNTSVVHHPAQPSSAAVT